MSEYEKISLRKVVQVEGLERSYSFTASAFCGPHTRVINADPTEILSLTHDVPGYKSEPIGSKLAQYRFERMLALDSQCPVVMPTIGVPFHSSEKISLYDADLVRGMIEKGVRQMPFCLSGLDENIEAFVETCQSADHPQSLDDVYRPSIEPEEFAGLDQSEYTIAFCMEEMIQSIDSHYNMHMGKYKFDDQDEFYSAFPLCRDMLDVLIASGCQYTAPERYWDGESILASMKEQAEKQKLQIGNENPSAIELVDRFSLLHERKLAKDKAATAIYMGIIEHTAETTLFRLTSHIAGLIASKTEARELAMSELSSDAKAYLRSFGQANNSQLGMNGPNAAPA